MNTGPVTAATPAPEPGSPGTPDGRTISGPADAATPGQALSPDPAAFAHHVRSTAFNVLTGKMSGDEWHVPRNERDAIACAVVDAVEPLIRADERAIAAREPHAADGLVTAKQERQPSREVNLLTDDEREPDCLAAHCPPSASVDCEWPKCSPTEQPAPDLAARPGEALAADNATLRDVITEVLGWFGDNTSGRYARVSGTVLARAYAKSPGIAVPEELRRYL